MEFLSLNRRRSSSRNAPSGEEQGETAVFAGYMMTSHSDLFRLRSLLCSFRPRKSVSIYPRSAFVYGPTISAIFLDYALLEICLTTIGKILVLYYCRVSDKTAWLIRKKKKKRKKKKEWKNLQRGLSIYFSSGFNSWLDINHMPEILSYPL